MESFRYAAFILVTLFSNNQANKIEESVLVTVPEYVIEGQTVHLYCTFSHAAFYTLKWFMNDVEIYRLVPDTQRELRRMAFNQQNVKVDLQSSKVIDDGRHLLVLQRVQSQQSGKYKCQVTEDSPPFTIKESTKVLTVIVLPEHYPTIAGVRDGWYRTGSLLTINCTAGPSYPASNLSWVINGKPANNWMVTEYIPQEVFGSDLLVSRLGLNLLLYKEHSRAGQVTIKCSATLPPVKGDQMLMSRTVSVALHAPLFSQLSTSTTTTCDILCRLVLLASLVLL